MTQQVAKVQLSMDVVFVKVEATNMRGKRAKAGQAGRQHNWSRNRAGCCHAFG